MFELRLQPNEQQLSPFYGMPVCLLMKDGSRKVGTLSACRSGQVILNGAVGADGNTAVSRKKTTRRINRTRTRTQKKFPAPEQPQIQGGDEFDLGPLGMGAAYEPSSPETVPVRSVESVIVL